MWLRLKRDIGHTIGPSGSGCLSAAGWELRGAWGLGLGLCLPLECASVLPMSLGSGYPCSLRVSHLRAVGFPGEGSEDSAKHPALLGILHLVAVEVVELGAPAAEHQSHGGGLQPCK